MEGYCKAMITVSAETHWLMIGLRSMRLGEIRKNLELMELGRDDGSTFGLTVINTVLSLRVFETYCKTTESQ